MKPILYVLTALLTGCAIDPSRVSAAPDMTICMAYGQYRQSSAWAAAAETTRKELEARRILTDAEWRAVNVRGLYIGMGLCAMYASMGMPSRENQHVTASGVMTQHIFGGPYQSAVYVYTRNGRVTSWQQ